MIAEEHFIRVERTARYYTQGECSINTTRLWIVCHGYGQLAGEFIQQFNLLEDGKTAIVAPEALSRYYPKATIPTVGASWMTREDRLHEILDYTQYLTRVYDEVVSSLTNLTEIHILGFSQGCATICRWVTMEKPVFNHLWICAGDIPPDIDFEVFRGLTSNNKLQVTLGTEDFLIPPDKLAQVKEKLAAESIEYDLNTFVGGHIVNVELIKSLSSK